MKTALPPSTDQLAASRSLSRGMENSTNATADAQTAKRREGQKAASAGPKLSPKKALGAARDIA